MRARRVCGVVLGLLAALAVVAWQAEAVIAIFMIWVVALGAIFFTSRATRNAHDERLDLPLGYRAAAAAALAVPLAGALLAAVPGHSDVSTLFVAHFAPVAFLAYRALVATGPRRALATLTLAQLLSVPFLFLGAFAAMACKRYRR